MSKITQIVDNIIDKVNDHTLHVSDNGNPHNVTKAQVGLGNADNTSDADKPVSTATQTALDGKLGLTAKAADSDKLDGLDASSYVKTTDIGSAVQAYNSQTTTQGNTFNGINQLVKLDATGKLPAIDGSQLTGIETAASNTDATSLKGKLINDTNLADGTVYMYNQSSDSFIAIDIDAYLGGLV